MSTANQGDERIGRLEQSLASLTKRGTKNARKWRNRGIALMVALVAVSAVAVAAITAGSTNFSGAKADVYAYDETTFTITSQGMDVTASAVAAAGTVGAPAEMGVTPGVANTAISAGHWSYAILVNEASIATLVSGSYRVELFVDGTSKGSLYLTQASADATAVEGVQMKWSLGSALAANAAYVVKVLPA